MMRRILSQRFFAAAVGATKPYVFVNKYTKVICQGMTGKEVIAFVANCRELFTLRKL